MKLSVIGCGYLGAVHAAAMASIGHDVVGIDVDVDVDERKVAALSAGEAPFFAIDISSRDAIAEIAEITGADATQLANREDVEATSCPKSITQISRRGNPLRARLRGADRNSHHNGSTSSGRAHRDTGSSPQLGRRSPGRRLGRAIKKRSVPKRGLSARARQNEGRRLAWPPSHQLSLTFS